MSHVTLGREGSEGREWTERGGGGEEWGTERDTKQSGLGRQVRRGQKELASAELYSGQLVPTETRARQQRVILTGTRYGAESERNSGRYWHVCEEKGQRGEEKRRRERSVPPNPQKKRPV